MTSTSPSTAAGTSPRRRWRSPPLSTMWRGDYHAHAAAAESATGGASSYRTPSPHLWRGGEGVRFAAAATAAALLITLAGTLLVDPGVPPWSRFWASAFFILLLWPVGLALVGRLAGGRAEVALAALLLVASVPQQVSPGTFLLPLTRESLSTARELSVVVRRQQAAGAPVAICGGQTDPAHAGRADRLIGGSWSSDRLADVPLPPVQGRPAPSRYYVELRLYDRDNRPSVGIWY